MSAEPCVITRILSSKTMCWLGSLAFPMFILHGPLGQLFYKKKVATRIFGRVQPQSFFPVYLLIVLLASHIVNETFVKNTKVQRMSANVAKYLAARTAGMLSDRDTGMKLEAYHGA